MPDLPVRLLAIDRPGYGGSSRQPGRTLLDWPQDVAFVLDRLGLARVFLIGLSGGAPYAAACACVWPERVHGLALVTPVPPSDGVPLETPGIGLLFRFGRRPVLARRLFALLRPLVHRRVLTPQRVLGRGMAPADRAVMSRPTLQGLARVWSEGVGRSIEGALSDAAIYAQPWGFDLAAIQVPTHVWIGGQDTLVPEPTLAPYRAIPGVAWQVMPEDGHFSLPLRHGPAMMAALLHGAALSHQLSSSASQ